MLPHRALCWQRRLIEYASWNSPRKKTAATLTTRTPCARPANVLPHGQVARRANALSDAGYMFTLSGADLIRDIYAYCSELAERSVFGTAEIKPGYVIKLVLRLFLMDGFGAMPA